MSADALAAADAVHATGDVAAALRMCETLVLATPDSAPLLIRRSRWTCGSLPNGDASVVRALLERAEADARRATVLEPMSAPAHKAVAVALGKKANIAGIGEKVAL